MEVLSSAIKTRLEKYEMFKASLYYKINQLIGRSVSALPSEFLTPLNEIIGFASLISDKDIYQSRSEKKFSNSIFESGSRLHYIINNFLQHTKDLFLKDALLSDYKLDTKIFINKIAEEIALKCDCEEDLVLMLEDFF